MMRRSIALFLTLVLVSQFMSVGQQQHEVTQRISLSNHNVVANLIEHAIISITSDSDFESQGWPGSGTSEEPYQITDLNVTSDEPCISISNTALYFEIRNCWIKSVSDRLESGIVLNNVTNGIVRNCTTISKNHGIYLYDSIDCTVSLVHSEYNRLDGIRVSASEDCIVDSCSINYNENYGLLILDSTNCNVTRCYAQDNVGQYDFGIGLENSDWCYVADSTSNSDSYGGFGILGSDHNLFVNNTSYENYEDGFELYQSRYNMFIDNNAHDNRYAGFSAREGDNNDFYNNTAVSNERYGLELYNHGSGICRGNNASYNDWNGFYLWYSVSETINDNIITNNGEEGIDLISSSSAVISENKITFSGDDGIRVNNSPCTITKNYFSSNAYAGIFLLTDACSITDNEFHQDGIYVDSYDYPEIAHTVINNTVNGKPIGYWHLQNNLEIDASNYSQIFVMRCNNVNITNGYFSNVTIGIQSAHVDNAIISNNTVVNAQGRGFVLQFTHGLVSQNLFHNIGDRALYAVYASGSEFRNNSVFDCGPSGIYIHESNGAVIDSNIAGGAVGTLRRDGNGFNIIGSEGTIVTNNVAFGNEQNGFFFESSDLCTIVNNTACENGYGIYLWDDANNNEFYGNHLGWNTVQNAYDEGGGNNFDNGVSIGNNWSHYIPPGPLSIPGPSSAVDNYPGMLNRTGPFIGNSPDMYIEAGAADAHVIWITYASHPESYELFRDGVLISNGAWNESVMAFAIGNLPPGIYSYTMVIEDNISKMVSDSLVVIITDTIAPTLSSPSDVEYEVGTTGNTISWTVSDLYPGNYHLYIDGELRESGEWLPPFLMLNIDGLEIGSYIVTLVLTDDSGNLISDEVQVIVVPATAPTIGPTDGPLMVLTIILILGSISILILVVVVRGKYPKQSS